MNSSSAAGNNSSFSSKPGKPKLAALTLLALGVVYGDIGTSPLYAFKEAFNGTHGLPLNEANVLAVLSLMFWSLMLIVSLKYVTMMLRFDNRGEGGILALLALASRATRDRHAKLGADPMPMTPEQFDAQMREDLATLGGLLRAAGVKAN